MGEARSRTGKKDDGREEPTQHLRKNRYGSSNSARGACALRDVGGLSDVRSVDDNKMMYTLRGLVQPLPDVPTVEDELHGRFLGRAFKLQMFTRSKSPACSGLLPAYVTQTFVLGDRSETTRDSRLHRAKESHRTDLVRRDGLELAAQGHARLGADSRRFAQEAVEDVARFEIDEQQDAVGPCLEDSGRSAIPKDSLAVSSSPLLSCLDWHVAANCQRKAKLGQVSRSPLGTRS